MNIYNLPPMDCVRIVLEHIRYHARDFLDSLIYRKKPGAKSYRALHNLRHLYDIRTEILIPAGKKNVLAPEELECNGDSVLLDLEAFCVDGQSVHPDVILYKPTGENRFAMAISSFPYSNDRYENPILLFSGDGKTWHEDRSISSPVKMFSHDQFGYHSDPSILLGEDGRLCFFNREVKIYTDGSAEVRVDLYKQKLAAGWEEPKPIFAKKCPWDNHKQFLSPSFLLQNDGYACWFAQKNEDGKFVVRHCKFDKNWILKKEENCFFAGLQEQELVWHLDVCACDGKLYMVADVRDKRSHVIRLFVSADEGICWRSGQTLVKSQKGFSEKVVYRCAILVENNEVFLYYSGKSKGDCWQTALKKLPFSRIQG